MLGGVGTGASKLDVTPIDRKRINDALDKQLERSSPSTSRTVINGKDNKPSAPQSLLMPKPLSDQRDSRSASLSKTNCSGGFFFSSLFMGFVYFSRFFISGLLFDFLLVSAVFSFVLGLLCLSFNWVFLKLCVQVMRISNLTYLLVLLVFSLVCRFRNSRIR